MSARCDVCTTPCSSRSAFDLTRGALIDISNDQYVPSNDGRHLALYVEPIADYTTEQYVDGFWTISALITPDVFARWPQLESYDICQEPLPSVDDKPEPFPITQINLTRQAAAEIDWEGGDLVDLLVALADQSRCPGGREPRPSPERALHGRRRRRPHQGRSQSGPGPDHRFG